MGENTLVTIHRSELIPGGRGARIGYSDDHPDKVFLVIPEDRPDLQEIEEP
jgi:hypothetical protein